jgi:hypothetical protein
MPNLIINNRTEIISPVKQGLTDIDCMVITKQTIDHEYATEIINYLESHANITKLDLGESSIADDAAKILAEHFQTSTSLKVIDLNDLLHLTTNSFFTEAEFLALLGSNLPEGKTLENTGIGDLEESVYEDAVTINADTIVIDVGTEEERASIFSLASRLIREIKDKSQIKTIKIIGELVDDNGDYPSDFDELKKITDQLTSVNVLDLSESEIMDGEYGTLHKILNKSSVKALYLADDQKMLFERDADNAKVTTLKGLGTMGTWQASRLREIATALEITNLDLSHCKANESFFNIGYGKPNISLMHYLGQTIGQCDYIRRLCFVEGQEIIFQDNDQGDKIVVVAGGSISTEIAEALTEILRGYSKTALYLSDCEVDTGAKSIFEKSGIAISPLQLNITTPQDPAPIDQRLSIEKIPEFIDNFVSKIEELDSELILDPVRIGKLEEEIRSAKATGKKISTSKTDAEKLMQEILIIQDIYNILCSTQSTTEKIQNINALHSILQDTSTSNSLAEIIAEAILELQDPLRLPQLEQKIREALYTSITDHYKLGKGHLPTEGQITSPIITTPVPTSPIKFVTALSSDFKIKDKAIIVENKAGNKLITEESAAALLQFAHQNTLATTINLSGCKVDEQAMKILVQGIQENSSISCLMLSDNQIYSFERNDKNKIKTLTLPITQYDRSYNYSLRKINADEALKLATALDEFQDLTTLDLSNCQLEKEAMKIIAEAIGRHQSISKIELKGSKFDDGIEDLAIALKQSKSIRYIGLRNAGIDKIKSLKDIVSSNQNIVFIDFTGNPLGRFTEEQEQLKQIFKRRRKKELKENLLDAAVNLANAAKCNPEGQGRHYSDELFQLIRQHLKDNETFSIGIESSNTKGSIEEMIVKQQQEILTAVAQGNKVPQEKTALKKRAQIIAIMQIATDILRNDDNKTISLKNLKEALDLGQQSDNPDQKFLSQLLEKTINKIQQEVSEAAVSETDIATYQKQISEDPPLYKRFKLRVLEAAKKIAIDDQELQQVATPDNTGIRVTINPLDTLKQSNPTLSPRHSIEIAQMMKLQFLKDALITSTVSLAIASNCSANRDKFLRKDSDELFALIRNYFRKGAKDLKKYDDKITDIEPEEILKKQKDDINGKYYSGLLDDPISLSKDPLERQAQMIAAIEIITEILGRDRRFFQIDESPIIAIQKLQRLFDLTSTASLSSSVSEPGLERDNLFLQQVFVKSLEKITQESDIKKTFVTQDEADQYEDYMSKLPPEKQHDYKKFKNQFLQTKFDSQERDVQYRHDLDYDDESETQSSYDSDDDFDEQLVLEKEVQILIKVLQELDKKPDHEQKSAVQTALCEAFTVSDMKSLITMLNDLTLENRGKPQYERRKIEDAIGDDAEEFLEDISGILRDDIKGSTYDPLVILDHIDQAIEDTKSNHQRKQMDVLGDQIMYLMNDLNTRFKKTTELGSGEVGPFAEYKLQGYSYYDDEPNTDQLSIKQILEEQKKSILANQKSLAKINLSLNPVIRRAQIIAVLEIIKDIKDDDSLLRLQDRFSRAENSSELLKQDKEFLDKVFADSLQMIGQEVRLKEIENQKLAAKTKQDKSSASRNFRVPNLGELIQKMLKKKTKPTSNPDAIITLDDSQILKGLTDLFKDGGYLLEISKKDKFSLTIPRFVPGIVEILAEKLSGNTTIKELNLTGITLTQESANLLVDMLNSTSITSLNLQNCKIEEGIRFTANFLAKKAKGLLNITINGDTFIKPIDPVTAQLQGLFDATRTTDQEDLTRSITPRILRSIKKQQKSVPPTAETALFTTAVPNSISQTTVLPTRQRVQITPNLPDIRGRVQSRDPQSPEPQTSASKSKISFKMPDMSGLYLEIDAMRQGLQDKYERFKASRKNTKAKVTNLTETHSAPSPTQRIPNHAENTAEKLELIQQKLQSYPDISIPTIKGQTFEELRKSVGGKVRINLPANLPRHLPVEFYLDGEESKLYEQINKTSELEWDKNSKTKGRDGASHPRLISFAATIDKDNQVKYRTIVTEAQGTFVHFPSQDQIKQKDDHIKQEFGKKIRDFNATGGTKSDEVSKSLEKKAIREFRQEEISKIGLKSHEILPISDIIQTYEEKYPSLITELRDLESTVPTINEDPGFCIFRPRGKNIAQVVFNLDENSDASTIDNVIYVSINGSGTKDQKPKYLRIRVGTFDGEVTETGETLKKGEVYIYPETYSKACDPTSAIADKDLSKQDVKARKNFKVLAVGVTKGPDNRKQISSSIMLDGEINKQEVQAMDKIKQSTTRDNSPTLYL